MIFTAELLEKVTSAVLCSFDGASSNQEKQKAFEYLEDLKENHPMVCLTIAFEFFKLNQQAMFHHYGLHLIESIIKYKWTGLKLDERTLVKDQLFLLVKSNYLTQNFIDPIYIRNSLTKCLIELIKRDCFDKGQTTFDEIVTMTQGLCQMQEQNFVQIELFLLVYRFLNEELTIYAHSIQAQRRRQIQNQIQKRLNDLIPCLIRLLNEFSMVSDQNQRLTQTCLLTLNSFLVWVDYTHFEQYELFLCDLFLKYFQLTSMKLRHASFECLLSLINKRLARRQLQQQQQQKKKRIAFSPSAAFNCQQEKRFLDYFLGNTTLEMFYRLLISPSNSIEQMRSIITNDHLNCLKMFGQLLVKLSNHLLQLFHQLATKSIDDSEFLSFVNERTRSFLQFLLLLNQHPFHQLSLNSYQALNSFLLRQPSLLSNEEFSLKLILNLKQSLHRIHFPSNSINETSIEPKHPLFEHNQQCLLYILFEYDSEEQFFWKFFSQYRSELQKLIKSFIGMFFNENATERPVDFERNFSCLRSILLNLFTYLESMIQRTANKTDENIEQSLLSIYLIIEWEAFYLLFDHIFFVIRGELYSSATTTIKSQQNIESMLMTTNVTEQFLRTTMFLLQFTPNLSEHIHGHVLNLLSCLFFITQRDSSIAVQLIQRLLNTYQFYQEQSIKTQIDTNACEIMQTQSSHAFLYLCKNYTMKMTEFYRDLFPYLCQLYQNEFEITKTFLPITIDESSCSTLKLLDALQILFYQKAQQEPVENMNIIEDYYQLVQPIYRTLNSSLLVDCLGNFLDYLNLPGTSSQTTNLIRYRRRSLMLSLHCLCLLLRLAKQQQQPINNELRSKISLCLRPLLFDYVLKVTQFCNQFYDRSSNPYFEQLKTCLTYSETEHQLYLGTYESNNVAKAIVPSTGMSTGVSVSFNSFASTSHTADDPRRLRDYLHRLFDICYQINGIYFVFDTDLFYLKFNEDSYFLSVFLQKILFENLKSLPSFRLRIVLRQFCRLFVESYCSLENADKESINELFLNFLDIFFPYLQQSLTTMWNNLLITTNNSKDGQCSDEVIEECVCVLITRDFLDIIRYFLYKANVNHQSNSNKKKSKPIHVRQDSESMVDDVNGDFDQIEEWDEQNTTHGISNKVLNSVQDKIEQSDLFIYMIRMARQNSPLSLRLFTNVIRIIFECLTYPDAYCVNRTLPIILPLTRLYTDIISKRHDTHTLVDIKALFQCLLKSLQQHNENEGLNTNLISLIGHIYELWHPFYPDQLDFVLYQIIPQLNMELLNNYKARLSTVNSKKPQPITERERRDTIKNLLQPILLAPLSSSKKENCSVGTSAFERSNSVMTT